MCVTAYCVHSQDDEDDEDPVIINAVSDAVKRHPNLVEVTLRWIFSRPPALGLVKGVLQKADVRKVVMKSWYTSKLLSCECECILCLCVVCVHMFIVCLHVFSYRGGHCPRVPHTCNEERVTEGSACCVDKYL